MLVPKMFFELTFLNIHFQDSFKEEQVRRIALLKRRSYYKSIINNSTQD